MDLLHLDFTKIEVSGDRKKELKKKPEVVNVLVVTDHFTRHRGLRNRGYDHSYRGPCPVPPLLLHLWHSAVSYDR